MDSNETYHNHQNKPNQTNKRMAFTEISALCFILSHVMQVHLIVEL